MNEDTRKETIKNNPPSFGVGWGATFQCFMITYITYIQLAILGVLNLGEKFGTWGAVGVIITSALLLMGVCKLIIDCVCRVINKYIEKGLL